MRANLERPCVALDQSVFLDIVNAPGTTVTCVQGCLWVTRQGCPRDFVLEPGDSYLVEDDRPVVVNGFGRSMATVRRRELQSRPLERRGSVAPRQRSRIQLMAARVLAAGRLGVAS